MGETSNHSSLVLRLLEEMQARFAPLLAGLALCVYPYFVDSVPWSLAIGAVLAAAPFFLDF